MSLHDHAKTIFDFLVAYTTNSDFFSSPDEIADPVLTIFSVEEDELAEAVVITFGVRPAEDAYEPSPEVRALAETCLAALYEQHPEFKTLPIVVDYTN